MQTVGILYLVDNLKVLGGTEKHLLQLLTHLDRRKFRPIVFSLREEGEVGRQIRRLGIRTDAANIKRFYVALGTAYKIRRIIRQENVKIIHTFFFDSDIMGSILGKLFRVPIIISSRRDMGNWWKKKRHIMCYRIVNRYFDKIIAVCNVLRDQLRDQEKIPEKKLLTIYNGADLDAYSPDVNGKYIRGKMSLKNHLSVIGMIANLDHIKDHGCFLTAASEVLRLNRDVCFIIVGEGPLRHDLERLSEQLGIQNSVFFLGMRKDIPEILSIFDISVLTSLSEGLSNTILESMSMGKPVVATEVGGNTEIVVDGETGFLVPPENPGAVAEKIVKLISDKSLIKRMGENARINIEKQFTVSQMVQKTEQIYENLLKSKCGYKL